MNIPAGTGEVKGLAVRKIHYILDHQIACLTLFFIGQSGNRHYAEAILVVYRDQARRKREVAFEPQGPVFYEGTQADGIQYPLAVRGGVFYGLKIVAGGIQTCHSVWSLIHVHIVYGPSEKRVDLVVRMGLPNAGVEFVEAFFRCEKQAVPVFEGIVVVFGREAFGNPVVPELVYAAVVLANAESVEPLHVMAEPYAAVVILLEGFAGQSETLKICPENPSATLSFKNERFGVRATQQAFRILLQLLQLPDSLEGDAVLYSAVFQHEHPAVVAAEEFIAYSLQAPDLSADSGNLYEIRVFHSCG